MTFETKLISCLYLYLTLDWLQAGGSGGGQVSGYTPAGGTGGGGYAGAQSEPMMGLNQTQKQVNAES